MSKEEYNEVIHHIAEQVYVDVRNYMLARVYHAFKGKRVTQQALADEFKIHRSRIAQLVKEVHE